MINCPNCKKLMEVCSFKNDKTEYEMLCRSCLSFWNMQKIRLSDEEIRELASE